MVEKRTDVYWTTLPNIPVPSSIYSDPKKYPVLAPCPNVSSYSRQTRIIETPFDLEIEPHFKYVEKINNYEFVEFTATSNDLQTENIWSPFTTLATGQDQWYDPLKSMFQISTPYIFVSEDKNLALNLMGLQSIETRNDYSQIGFIEARLNIGKMARSLAAPFAFQTLNGKAKFIKGQPLYKIVFNKPVRLHKISAGPLLQQWIDTNLSMTMYTKKTTRYNETIFKRRPKKMFDEIKNNIEYSEA